MIIKAEGRLKLKLRYLLKGIQLEEIKNVLKNGKRLNRKFMRALLRNIVRLWAIFFKDQLELDLDQELTAEDIVDPS